MNNKLDDIELSLSKIVDCLDRLEIKINSLEGLIQNYAQSTAEDFQKVKSDIKKLKNASNASNGHIA